MNLEETLNGGYGGLFGEVVTHDCYRIRSLGFTPQVILDVGANIGVFARFAHETFPFSRIISVEPDPNNIQTFRQFTNFQNVLLIEKGLGDGQLYHPLTARNGSGEVYISAGLGYPQDKLEQSEFERPAVKAVRLHELVGEYCRKDQRTMLKLDCEGAENSIWDHPMDMRALKTFDYIAGEIHFYAHTADELQEVREKTLRALAELSETHEVEMDNVHLWALKKYDENQIPARPLATVQRARHGG